MKALAVAMLVAGCSAAPQEKAAEPVALVSLAKAEPGLVQETVRIYGTADPGPGGSAILSAPQEAVVATIETPVGAIVRQGQLVVRLAPSPAARLDFVRAENDARAARLAYARAKRLRGDGLVGNAEVETTHAAVQSASATASSLAARNAALALRSPVAGQVESIAAGPGSLVTAGTAIATIARAGDLRARFEIEPALARRIPSGAVVKVTPSSGGSPVTVPLLSVDPFVDPQTGLASLFVRLPADARIGTGEPVTGEMLIAGAAEAPTVPYAALLDEGGQPFVFVVAGGAAHRRDIAPGPANGDRVTILRGLKSGEAVVVEGGTALEDGMKVRTR